GLRVLSEQRVHIVQELLPDTRIAVDHSLQTARGNSERLARNPHHGAIRRTHGSKHGRNSNISKAANDGDFDWAVTTRTSQQRCHAALDEEDELNAPILRL